MPTRDNLVCWHSTGGSTLLGGWFTEMECDLFEKFNLTLFGWLVGETVEKQRGSFSRAADVVGCDEGKVVCLFACLIFDLLIYLYFLFVF